MRFQRPCMHACVHTWGTIGGHGFKSGDSIRTGGRVDGWWWQKHAQSHGPYNEICLFPLPPAFLPACLPACLLVRPPPCLPACLLASMPSEYPPVFPPGLLFLSPPSVLQSLTCTGLMSTAHQMATLTPGSQPTATQVPPSPAPPTRTPTHSLRLRCGTTTTLPA